MKIFKKKKFSIERIVDITLLTRSTIEFNAGRH